FILNIVERPEVIPHKKTGSCRWLTFVIPERRASDILLCFLSILSIKRRNWFYWADRAERADRAEIKESPVFMRIWVYVAGNQ
ncbi:MAG: hypothetical protein ACXWBH_03490, partial [Candidatus Angelobacter sp.]